MAFYFIGLFLYFTRVFFLLKTIFFLKLAGMGYVFSFTDAVNYDRWCTRPGNRAVITFENHLMLEMLQPIPGKTILDIGCGTGMGTLSLVDAGLQVTGIEPSPYMMDIAQNCIGNRVDFHRGFAEKLPFGDNEFNYSCLVTTLEFVERPQKALEEAFRVTRDKIFIGILNRYAMKSIQRRIKGIFAKTIYNRARFFSIWEMKQMIRAILGEVPVLWQSTCSSQMSTGTFANRIEPSKIIQKNPFGTFLGIAVMPVPRFRSRPLVLKYPAKTKQETLVGNP